MSQIKRSPNFNEAESKALIKIWGCSEFQLRFNKAKRHVKIWNDIAAELYAAGIIDKVPNFPMRDGPEVNQRFKNMKRDYTKLKNHHSGDEAVDIDDPYFELFDAVLGCRPSYDPPMVIDAMNDNNVNAVSENEIDESEISKIAMPPNQSSDGSVKDEASTSKSCNQKVKLGKKRLADMEYNKNSLELQRKQLKLLEDNQSGEKKLFVAMQSFFESGAAYFDAKSRVLNNSNV